MLFKLLTIYYLVSVLILTDVDLTIFLNTTKSRRKVAWQCDLTKLFFVKSPEKKKSKFLYVFAFGYVLNEDKENFQTIDNPAVQWKQALISSCWKIITRSSWYILMSVVIWRKSWKICQFWFTIRYFTYFRFQLQDWRKYTAQIKEVHLRFCNNWSQLYYQADNHELL